MRAASSRGAFLARFLNARLTLQRWSAPVRHRSLCGIHVPRIVIFPHHEERVRVNRCQIGIAAVAVAVYVRRLGPRDAVVFRARYCHARPLLQMRLGREHCAVEALKTVIQHKQRQIEG